MPWFSGSSAPRHRSRTASRWRAFSLALLAGAGTWFLLAGCAPRESPVAQGVREQVLHRGMGPEVSDLDPHLATGTSDYTVLSALFEGLVAEDPVTLRPAPGVAERWEASPDHRVYTFHLRSTARWSNGDPLTARDFLASWRRVLTPSLGADYASLLYVVRGAADFHQGRTTDFSQVGFQAPTPHTLAITLQHPAPHFLSLLQHWVWWPVHLPTLEQFGSPYERGSRWARPESFVGNGPFVLRQWRTGQRIVVERSPTYWDAATVRLQAIHFHPIEDVNAEERAFRSGQLHVTEALPVGRIEAYRRDQPHLLRIDPYLGTYFYRFNLKHPALQNPALRRALALAIDREGIVRQILRGGQTPARAFTPPGTGGYTPAAQLAGDFAEARRLLAAAGYPGGQGAPALDLLYNTSDNHRLIAEAIQEMWRRELGLEVRLVNMENQSVLAARRAGDFQILRSSWIADYDDPASFLHLWTSHSGNNYTGWSDAPYDALIEKAARTGDPEERRELFQQAEARLLQELPFIPLYHFTHVFLLHPAVRGWHPTLLDHHPYKHVWLEAEGSEKARE